MAGAFLAVIAGFFVAAAGPAPAATALPPYRMESGVSYGPFAAETGDMYWPAGPAKPLPAILVIHGGGWTEGNRLIYSDYCAAMAGLGFVVFNIDYRLANPAEPATRWPAQLLDAQLAVRFLRANSRRFNLDPARLAALGQSVGGTLALSLALHRKLIPGDVAMLYAGQSPAVMAAVDEFGPVDHGTLVGRAWDQAYLALFGTKNPVLSMRQAMSPLAAIDSRDAAVLVIHGDKDILVPVQQAQQAADALRAHGVAVELVIYHGGHGFLETAPDAVAEVVSHVNAFLTEKLRPLP